MRPGKFFLCCALGGWLRGFGRLVAAPWETVCCALGCGLLDFVFAVPAGFDGAKNGWERLKNCAAGTRAEERFWGKRKFFVWWLAQKVLSLQGNKDN